MMSRALKNLILKLKAKTVDIDDRNCAFGRTTVLFFFFIIFFIFCSIKNAGLSKTNKKLELKR